MAADDIYLYDLVLIPVDEWATDSYNFSLEALVGRHFNDTTAAARFLDVDAVGFPKEPLRAIARLASEAVWASYTPVTNGVPLLQSNAAQRLWFLCQNMDWDDPNKRCSYPEVCNTPESRRQNRYRALRGAR